MPNTAVTIEELYRRFPNTPELKVLRTDVLREGVQLTPNLCEIGKWAVPENLYVFEADHYVHLKDFQRMSQDQRITAISQGWVNSPYGFRLRDDFLIQIGFNPKSPYEIAGSGQEGDEHWLYRNGKQLEPITFDKRPRWMEQKTSDGTLMANVLQIQGKGVLDGLLLRHCEYFNTNDSCRFCSIVGGSRETRKAGVKHEMGQRVQRLVETFDAALSDDNEILVLIMTGGSLIDDHREAEMWVDAWQALAAVKRKHLPKSQKTTLLAGMLAFEKEDNQRIKDAGLDVVTNDMEVWAEPLWPVVVPGKQKYIGREKWMHRMVDAVDVFGRYAVATNFVVGVELVEPWGFKTFEEGIASQEEGFRWCLENGIAPITTIWRAKAGSAWANVEPPPTDYFLRVGAVRRKLIKEYDMHTGALDIWK